MSFSTDSLSSDMWANAGTLGSTVDIDGFTGIVQSEKTNGGRSIDALCFDNSIDNVTLIQYDTNHATRPDLTMEIWYKPMEYPDSNDWILGHDDWGFNRAIISYDTRFSGLAMGIGRRYTSTLGYPSLGQWVHIVAVYSSDGIATLYQNGGDLSGGSQQSMTVTANSGSVETNVGLNGLANRDDHFVVGCFAQIQMTNHSLDAEEVSDLYARFDSVINSEPVIVPGTIS